MKTLIFTFILSFSAFAKTDLTNVMCVYYDDPQSNPRLAVEFRDGLVEVTKNKTLSDDGPYSRIFKGKYEARVVNKVLIVTAKDLQLEMKLPIGEWNRGSEKDSTLKIPSKNIAVKL